MATAPQPNETTPGDNIPDGEGSEVGPPAETADGIADATEPGPFNPQIDPATLADLTGGVSQAKLAELPDEVLASMTYVPTTIQADPPAPAPTPPAPAPAPEPAPPPVEPPAPAPAP